MAIFHDIIQNEDTWLQKRLGVFTASSFSDLFMTKDKIGYKKAISKVVYERITGESYEHYSNARMNVGHDLEILAKEHYEMQTFCKISNGGFFEYNEWIGASPDGCVKDNNLNGLVEFKSRDPHIYFEYLETGKLPPVNKHQVYGQLWVSGYDFLDYMPYCSPKLKTLIIRVYPDKEIFDQLENKLIECIKEATALINKFKN